MAVGTTQQLPEEPTIGSLEFVPLGGDGWIAPQSMYVGRTQSTGDASGGAHSITINADPRFTQICAVLEAEFEAAAAARFAKLVVQERSIASRVNFAGDSSFDAGLEATGSNTAFLGWNPPPHALRYTEENPSFVQFLCTNVNAEDIYLEFRLFNFNIRAPEVALWQWLASSQPARPYS